MSETLFAYTITDAGYKKGTAGAISGERSAATPAAFSVQKDKITLLNGDPAIFNFFDNSNQSRLVLRQYTYSTTNLRPNQIINPFAASWTPVIAEQIWNDIANLHAVATKEKWLYATGYDLGRIAVVNMKIGYMQTSTSYQFPAAWPGISLPAGAQCHGEGLVVVGDYLYALFSVNPQGGYAVYSNSIVVKLEIDTEDGTLSYVSHIEVGKNAFTLDHFNNKLYICAVGGMQNAGSANADTCLDIVDLSTFTKTSVSTIPSIGGDFRDITIKDANTVYIFVGHYDGTFANMLGGVYHTSVANIPSPASWTKIASVSSPGYLWGIYAENNRLWFVKGTPLEIFAPLPTAAAFPVKAFTAGDLGNFGSNANLNSATVVAPNPAAVAGVTMEAAVVKSFAGHAILAQQARKAAEALKAAAEAAAGEEEI